MNLSDNWLTYVYIKVHVSISIVFSLSLCPFSISFSHSHSACFAVWLTIGIIHIFVPRQLGLDLDSVDFCFVIHTSNELYSIFWWRVGNLLSRCKYMYGVTILTKFESNFQPRQNKANYEIYIFYIYNAGI